MDAVVTALTTGITPATIMEPIADIVPFLIVIFPVSIGLMFLRKTVKGASKAKVKF